MQENSNTSERIEEQSSKVDSGDDPAADSGNNEAVPGLQSDIAQPQSQIETVVQHVVEETEDMKAEAAGYFISVNALPPSNPSQSAALAPIEHSVAGTPSHSSLNVSAGRETPGKDLASLGKAERIIEANLKEQSDGRQLAQFQIGQADIANSSGLSATTHGGFEFSSSLMTGPEVMKTSVPLKESAPLTDGVSHLVHQSALIDMPAGSAVTLVEAPEPAGNETFASQGHSENPCATEALAETQELSQFVEGNDFAANLLSPTPTVIANQTPVGTRSQEKQIPTFTTSDLPEHVTSILESDGDYKPVALPHNTIPNYDVVDPEGANAMFDSDSLSQFEQKTKYDGVFSKDAVAEELCLLQSGQVEATEVQAVSDETKLSSGQQYSEPVTSLVPLNSRDVPLDETRELENSMAASPLHYDITMDEPPLEDISAVNVATHTNPVLGVSKAVVSTLDPVNEDSHDCVLARMKSDNNDMKAINFDAALKPAALFLPQLQTPSNASHEHQSLEAVVNVGSGGNEMLVTNLEKVAPVIANEVVSVTLSNVPVSDVPQAHTFSHLPPVQELPKSNIGASLHLNSSVKPGSVDSIGGPDGDWNAGSSNVTVLGAQSEMTVEDEHASSVDFYGDKVLEANSELMGKLSGPPTQDSGIQPFERQGSKSTLHAAESTALANVDFSAQQTDNILLPNINLCAQPTDNVLLPNVDLSVQQTDNVLDVEGGKSNDAGIVAPGNAELVLNNLEASEMTGASGSAQRLESAQLVLDGEVSSRHNQNQLYCPVCDLRCQTTAQLEEHRKGKKHAKKYQASRLIELGSGLSNVNVPQTGTTASEPERDTLGDFEEADHRQIVDPSQPSEMIPLSASQSHAHGKDEVPMQADAVVDLEVGDAVLAASESLQGANSTMIHEKSSDMSSIVEDPAPSLAQNSPSTMSGPHNQQNSQELASFGSDPKPVSFSTPSSFPNSRLNPGATIFAPRAGFGLVIQNNSSEHADGNDASVVTVAAVNQNSTESKSISLEQPVNAFNSNFVGSRNEEIVLFEKAGVNVKYVVDVGEERRKIRKMPKTYHIKIVAGGERVGGIEFREGDSEGPIWYFMKGGANSLKCLRLKTDQSSIVLTRIGTETAVDGKDVPTDKIIIELSSREESARFATAVTELEKKVAQAGVNVFATDPSGPIKTSPKQAVAILSLEKSSIDQNSSAKPAPLREDIERKLREKKLAALKSIKKKPLFTPPASIKPLLKQFGTKDQQNNGASNIAASVTGLGTSTGLGASGSSHDVDPGVSATSKRNIDDVGETSRPQVEKKVKFDIPTLNEIGSESTRDALSADIGEITSSRDLMIKKSSSPEVPEQRVANKINGAEFRGKEDRGTGPHLWGASESGQGIKGKADEVGKESVMTVPDGTYAMLRSQIGDLEEANRSLVKDIEYHKRLGSETTAALLDAKNRILASRTHIGQVAESAMEQCRKIESAYESFFSKKERLTGMTCRPWSAEDFFARLDTFSPQTWYGFAEIGKISPVECARHGWFNSGTNVLTSTDGAKLAFNADAALIDCSSYSAEVKRIREGIVAKGHKMLSEWIGSSCPESFCGLGVRACTKSALQESASHIRECAISGILPSNSPVLLALKGDEASALAALCWKLESLPASRRVVFTCGWCRAICEIPDSIVNSEKHIETGDLQLSCREVQDELAHFPFCPIEKQDGWKQHVAVLLDDSAS